MTICCIPRCSLADDVEIEYAKQLIEPLLGDIDKLSLK